MHLILAPPVVLVGMSRTDNVVVTPNKNYTTSLEDLKQFMTDLGFGSSETLEMLEFENLVGHYCARVCGVCVP